MILAVPMKLYQDGPNELLIVQKWKDSSSVIVFKVTFGSIELQARAHVTEVNPARVVLTILGERNGWFAFDPSTAVFRYQDPRESDPSVKEDVESKAVCALTAVLPGNVDLFMFEWREGVES